MRYFEWIGGGKSVPDYFDIYDDNDRLIKILNVYTKSYEYEFESTLDYIRPTKTSDVKYNELTEQEYKQKCFLILL